MASGSGWYVGFRNDPKRRGLERRILNELDLDAQETCLTERRKLARYGPEPDEIEKVLNARYELFRRALWGTRLVMLAVHDTKTRQITILDVAEPKPGPSLYEEACRALDLGVVVRERRSEQ